MSHRDLKEGCVRLNSCDLAGRPELVVACGIDWSPIELRADCTWTPRCWLPQLCCGLGPTKGLWSTDSGRFVGSCCTCSTDLGRSRPHISGLHQAFASMDGGIGRFAASGRCGSGCSEGTGRHWLGCVGFRDVRRRREPGRTSSDTVSRTGVFVVASNTPLPQGPPTAKRAGDATEEIEFSPVVADDDVACADGLALGLADRPCRQQRTRALLEMLSTLPKKALIAADAGFVGYQYAREVLDSIVCSPLGHRVVLSPFEADLSAAQTSQRTCRERSHRDGMVPDRTVGNGSLRASLAPSSRNLTATAECRRHAACVPTHAARLSTSDRTGISITRSNPYRRHRRLPAQKQNKPWLSTQKTRATPWSADNRQRLRNTTPLGAFTSSKGLTA